MNNKKDLSVYVHIPFCVRKCAYCDFVSYTDRFSDADKYCKVVIDELAQYDLDNYRVRTVFFGGGTPSSLNTDLIGEILSAVSEKCGVADNAEITLECNPCTLNASKLAQYKSMGINRLSIGVQSFDDGLLKLIGRVHDADTARKCIERAKKAGFENINTDMMFAIPGQTEKILIDSINECIALSPEHISLYSLILEEGTRLNDAVMCGKLERIDDDTDRRMYRTACGLLERAGYVQYEISNFAKPGYESQHNIVYWKRGEYIGLGCAAHSFFKGMRYENLCGIDEYTEAVNKGKNIINKTEITLKDAAEETVMLGLRMNEGICERDFFDAAGFDIRIQCSSSLDKLEKEGLIGFSDGRIFATDEGRDVLNYIILQIVSDFK